MTSSSSENDAIFVKCIHSTGRALGRPDRSRFYSDDTEFDLCVGVSYPVLGIGIFETVVLALVHDETEKPNWLPIGLFEFKQVTIPGDWLFSIEDGLAASGGNADNRWTAKCGYARLVNDSSHSDGLVERDEGHLRHYYAELLSRTGITRST